MKNIADKLEEIKNQTDVQKAKFEQLVTFEDTLKELATLITLEKPTYTYPQVDTLGKQTYISLSKK